jgi:hypothetical protein
VTPGVEGLLKVAHVGILFGVYTRVREKDGEITMEENKLLDTVDPYAKVFEHLLDHKSHCERRA